MKIDWKQSWRFVLFPALFYLAWFIILTFPAILKLNSHIWAGRGDGMTMVWNIWWVDKAVRELHSHPWFTDYLFHPMGTSLLVHTMHPLKGLMAIPMLKILPPITNYNVLVILSFVFSGMSAFWLAFVLVRSYWPAILAGFIFTFSSFHFQHAQGHLHLISLEWMPIFVLAWYSFLKNPNWWKAVLSGVVLFLVFLCDAYYMMYCVLFGAVMVAWWCFRERSLWFLLRREYRLPLAIFVIVCLCTTGALAGALLHAMKSDPPPFFPAWEHSMDLLAPFIPGYHWRFAELTEGYWSKIPGKVHGNSMYIGWSVVILVVYAFLNRKKIDYRDLGMWFLLALFFAAMALGPKLYIWGWEAPYFGDPDHRLIKMPYGFMQKFIPGLKVGARPNRLFIMAILAITMIAAHAYRQLRASGPKSRVFALALLPLLLVEYLPSPLPATDPQVPAYIAKLNEAEGEGALFDVITHKARVLFLQTLHERPIPRGWIARVGRSRMIQISEQTKLREEGRYAEIRDRHHYRFVLDEASRMDAILESCGGGVVLHKDSEFVLIDMQAANSGSDTAIREETVP